MRLNRFPPVFWFALVCLIAYFSFGNLANNDVCASNLDDNISCGEEILDPLSRGSIRFRAAENYQALESLAALKSYQDSWQRERKDAETLIYLNNALLDAYDINAVNYQTFIARR